MCPSLVDSCRQCAPPMHRCSTSSWTASGLVVKRTGSKPRNQIDSCVDPKHPYSQRGGPVTGSRPWLRFHYRPLPPRCLPLGLLCSPQRRGTKLRLLPPSPRLSFPASASCSLTARADPSCPAQPVTHVLIVPTSSPQTTYSASQKWKSSKTPPPSLVVKRLLRHHPHAVLQHCDP